MNINQHLAKAVIENYPYAEDAGLHSINNPTLEKLYKKELYGDSLLRHIIVELKEGAELDDGSYSKETAISLLERSRDDIQRVIDGIYRIGQ